MTDTRYSQRLQAWGTLGYRFAYTQAAQIVGHLGIGLLAPFKLKFSKNKKNNSLVHENLKNKSVWYKALYRYMQILHKANQEFLMRPVANIAGIIGGLIGSVLGVFLSVVPRTPTEPHQVTKENKFFSKIYISKKTQKFFGVLVWAGILGAAFGTLYPVPIVIFGQSFQGALAFSQLFSGLGTFLYQLPDMIKNTWVLIKKIAETIKYSVTWFLNTLDKIIAFVLKNTLYYVKKIGLALKDSVVWGLTKFQNLCNTTWANLVALKDKIVSFASGVKTWAVAQFNYVVGKVTKVLNVIKENGLRGLLAFAKDKTFGTILRYLDNLAGVREANSKIRKLVDTLLDNEAKKPLLLKIIDNRIDWLTLDLSALSKVKQVDIMMSHINAIAEGHRTNYQKGNIEVKLAYLEKLKLALGNLNKLDLDSVDNKTEALTTELKELLSSDYRSWNINVVELDKPNQVLFSQFGSGSSLEAQASNDGVNLQNDSAKSKHQLKAKK